MKTIAISLSSSALILGLSLATFAGAQQSRRPITIEGKHHPILLARMMVEATPLPERTD